MLIQDNPLGFSKASLGGHSARSMMFLEMRTLVRAMPLTVTKDDFTKAIVEENVLEKPTLSSRKKSLRHLMELYGMDPSKALFRVLWDLGHADLDSLPQLCLVCAYARDPQLRHSFELIRTLRLGEVLERAAMEQHLENGFPGRFSPAMKKSMAQKREHHLDIWRAPRRQSEEDQATSRAPSHFGCLRHVCRLLDRSSW